MSGFGQYDNKMQGGPTRPPLRIPTQNRRVARYSAIPCV
jgi:hypothetical protein